MKRLHKKILIVIHLKIIEILIVLGCVIIFASIIYGLSWLIVTLGIAELLKIALAWTFVGIVGLAFLFAIGVIIVEWFKWNWGKAERIIERKGERLK